MKNWKISVVYTEAVNFETCYFIILRDDLLRTSSDGLNIRITASRILGVSTDNSKQLEAGNSFCVFKDLFIM